jgi:hypothetical protein
MAANLSPQHALVEAKRTLLSSSKVVVQRVVDLFPHVRPNATIPDLSCVTPY